MFKLHLAVCAFTGLTALQATSVGGKIHFCVVETLHLGGLNVSTYPQFNPGETAAHAATPVQLS